MAAEYTTVAAVWDSIAVQVGRLDRGRHAEFPICKVQVLSNASALSDARFGEMGASLHDALCAFDKAV